MNTRSIESVTQPSIDFWTHPDAMMRAQLSAVVAHDFKFYPEGWDGAGAAALAPDAKREAASFLQVLPPGTTYPHVSAGYDGSLGLSWSVKDLTLFVHFSPHGSMDFTFNLGRHKTGETPWIYSKRMSASDPALLDELRPTFGYIGTSMVVIELTVMTCTINVLTSTTKVPRSKSLETRKSLGTRKALPG